MFLARKVMGVTCLLAENNRKIPLGVETWNLQHLEEQVWCSKRNLDE
jgi:hypothetical protein